MQKKSACDKNGSHTIQICSDSQAALSALNSNGIIVSWCGITAEAWLTKGNIPDACAGHSNIVGNEEADRLACQGSRSAIVEFTVTTEIGFTQSSCEIELFLADGNFCGKTRGFWAEFWCPTLLGSQVWYFAWMWNQTVDHLWYYVLGQVRKNCNQRKKEKEPIEASLADCGDHDINKKMSRTYAKPLKLPKNSLWWKITRDENKN